MRRAFEVVPPDARMIWWLPAISMGAATVGIAFAAREEPRAWLLLIVIALVCGVIVWSLRRRTVAIEGDTLRIAAGLNSTAIPLDTLDIASARIVDLDKEPGLRPMLKTFGTSMPGYHAGHFRLRDRSRGFLLLTARRKVLALRERDGRTILLSLVRPQALIDALGEHAARKGG
jgi:hypothetical protein